ncbi:contractile injection system tape measure protein [Limnoraphis robusta CCNP1315]|uniref:Contractile injection system tape measure protein n=2 Tax=Limnoraphis TaxID=1332112 RepID=A0ABU5U3A2_9CYAN|nr:contractile injection system tape measure protein [Limnoraphis robusta]MEA5521391.1 contractile injection system tape measure protein [Limnoraphis robusta CCNP1315]
MRLEIWQRILFTVSSPGNIKLDKSELIQANLLQIATENIISEIATKKGSQLEILSYFIQTGILPWWSEKLSKQQLEEYCDRLIETSPNQMKSMIGQSLKNEKQLQRIIYQFSDAILLKIAGLFASNLVHFIDEYNTNIKFILKQLDRTKSISENKLRLEIWQRILFTVSSPGNIELDKSELIQANLLQIATENIISEIATKKGSQLEILSYFIQTGILPWWSEKLSKQQLEEYCDRLIETSPDQIKRLVENSIKDERQLRRIIFQFSEPTLLKIAELMADNLSAFLSDYLIVINKTLKGSDLTATRIPENRLKWELWRGILLSLYEKGNHPPDPSQLIAENLLYLATRLPCEYRRLLRQAIETIASLKTEGQSFRSSLPEELVKLSDRHPTQLQSPNHSETSSQPLSPDAIGPLNKSEEFPTPSDRHLHQSDLQNLPEIPSRQWEPFSDAIAPFSDSEEIYIDNAGLILLWPFLNPYFSQLRLVEQNYFVNDQAAERAALLLQYLVDASVDPPEHLLPLNKILCDIELLDPLNTHLDITEAEQSECENLLSAVIQNWSILKNTSIAGFRQAFLQRNGILKVHNGEWLLQIERETYDILLDRIPWSIRVVKLPWMDNILHIEW